jgi:hypothetical protein
MLFFRFLLVVDAIATAILLYFFQAGLADGTVSSFNASIWAVLVILPMASITGGLMLRKAGQKVLANLLLLVPAIPALAYGLIIALLVLLHPSFH